MRRVGFRLGDRVVDGIDVVAVDRPDHLPAVRTETRRAVVGEPALYMAVDRDAVVVVQRDQLAELPGTGQRGCLMRNAFHQAAVAEEHVGVMVYDRGTCPVELGREQFFRECHADCVGESLPERAGGRLDARCHIDLGMARRLRMQLAEVLQFVERQVVAGQVQQRVLQHRAMTVRQHEAVAIGPVRVGRVVLEVPSPQRNRDLRHPHRHPRMTRFRLLDRVGGKEADRIGHPCGIGDAAGRGRDLAHDNALQMARPWPRARKSRQMTGVEGKDSPD